MTTLTDVTSCKECGSKSLTWFTQKVVFNGVPQNRLNTSDVKCQFVLGCDDCSETLKVIRADTVAEHLNAAPIAQTAPQGKFTMGELVKKTSGSEWQGRICGTYSTSLTPEGYAVESEAHAGSVQIYPAKALEAVDD
jgi:hypothetical protein